MCSFFFFWFLIRCRILDSMKVPGQRSSFHICDILDLNSTDSKNTNNNNNNNNTTNNNSNENANTNTSFASQTNTTSTSSRDDGASSITVQPPPPIPPPPYQLPASFNSAIYSELGHHYHSMFPAATKSWLREHHEHYGKFKRTLFGRFWWFFRYPLGHPSTVFGVSQWIFSSLKKSNLWKINSSSGALEKIKSKKVCSSCYSSSEM